MYLGSAAALKALKGWVLIFEKIVEQLEARPTEKLAQDLLRVSEQARSDLSELKIGSSEYIEYKAWIDWAENIGDQTSKYLSSLQSWVLPDRAAVAAIVIREDERLAKVLALDVRRRAESTMMWLKLAAVASLGVTVVGMLMVRRKKKRH
jgi:hypothetical protein